MLKTELEEIIANGENSGVEFKRDKIRPEELAIEIVALANLQGGRILIGVEDNGAVSGIQRSNLEEWVMNIFNDKVHPTIIPYYEEICIEVNKKIAVISFPQGISKPYVLRHKGREEIYIRVGSTSRRASREQQARLYATGGMIHTEILPVPGTDVSSLDKARLKNYFEDIIEDPEIPSEDSEWETRLCQLGLMIETVNNKTLCTIAGLVLFGINPRRYLKQAGLRVMVFPGDDKDFEAKLDVTLDSSLLGRWDIKNRVKTLIDMGLTERFMENIHPFILNVSGEVDNGLKRERNLSIPIEVIREVLLNALAHRDWTRYVDIEISLYSNRLEVISPGTLPNDMTIEKMKAGQRLPRNTIIMEILRDYGYVDFRGMGVRTKIIPLMKKYNDTEPEFIVTEDYVKLILPFKSME